MHGSLCHNSGVLYVGRHRKDAWITAYDLDGRALGTQFRFMDEHLLRSAAAGLSMDGDHRLWVADTPAGKLRAFTLFGKEVATVGEGGDQGADEAGCMGTPVDVVARGADDELEVWVASGGMRRHALHVLLPESGKFRSLRPEGDPRGRFRRLRALDVRGDSIFALEGGAQRMQVFRGLEHHYSLDLSESLPGDAEPVAFATLSDSRMVVAFEGPGGGLLLLGAEGQVRGVLAHSGRDVGQVDHPCAVVVVNEEELADGGPTRVFCLDLDGERVQVFNLEGQCYGAFPVLLD
ncbi:MAG: hypothetical protein ACI8QC_001199 [Planctomycetota bacterium]|jgi:hypothetical protein